MKPDRVMAKMIRLLVILTAFLFVVSAVFASDPTSDPDFIHLSWQHDPATTMTIMWRTSTGTTPSVVEYGLTQAYGRQATGGYALLPEGRGNSHTVEITGLAPRTDYHYRVGDGGVHWSADYIFTTAPAASNACAPVTFVALGDSRTSSSSHHGAGSHWDDVMAEAVSHYPDFIIHAADAIRTGSYQEDGWESFFERDGVAASIVEQPMMMSWGNHDLGGSPPYYPRNFSLPVNAVTGTEDFYDFRTGPVHFFSLDTEHGTGQYSTVATWLDGKLETTDAIWNIAFHHKPGYSSGTAHGNEEDVLDYYAPVFDEHHLDISFAGHDHHYERSKAIFENTAYGENYDAGTMYVVTGGAGAPLYDFNSGTWFHQTGTKDFHFVLVDVLFDTLIMTTYGIDGTVFDTVTLVKEEAGYPEAAITVETPEIYAGEPASFNAFASHDPCGALMGYTWFFGDGNDGEGEEVDHVYATPGLYTLSLTVTDSDTNTADDSVLLDVSCRDCEIAGACIVDGATNPVNPCQICDPSGDPLGWSANDGVPCNDGLFCNGTDTCADGSCDSHAGDPCSGSGMSCNEEEDVCEDDETGIVLASFHADEVAGDVLLAWVTTAEPGNAGFRLWRADDPDSGFGLITPSLIASRGSETHGASYSWTDKDVEPGNSYQYKLESVNVNGDSFFHGPVHVTLPEEPFYGCGIS